MSSMTKGVFLVFSCRWCGGLLDYRQDFWDPTTRQFFFYFYGMTCLLLWPLTRVGQKIIDSCESLGESLLLWWHVVFLRNRNISSLRGFQQMGWQDLEGLFSRLGSKHRRWFPLHLALLVLMGVYGCVCTAVAMVYIIPWRVLVLSIASCCMVYIRWLHSRSCLVSLLCRFLECVLESLVSTDSAVGIRRVCLYL